MPIARRLKLMRGGAPAAISDLFTDSNGVAIGSHTMTSGSGWTVLAGSGAIQSNKLQSATSGTMMRLKTRTRNADGAVSADATLPASGPVCAGHFLRVTDANTGYGALLTNDGSQLYLTLVKFNGVM